MRKRFITKDGENKKFKPRIQAVVEKQLKMQTVFKMKQKLKEMEWDRKVEPAIYRAYPPMVEYYATLAPYARVFFAFLTIVAVVMLLGIFLWSAFEYGWGYAINDLKEFLGTTRWYHAVGVFVFLLLMGMPLVLPSVLTKYMENTVTIFTKKCVYIRKYFRKDKIVTYEELKNSINRRKICIRNGYYRIPCKGMNIAVPLFGAEFPDALFCLLEKKCNIRLPKNDIGQKAQRSGMGWACGHLGGGIMLVFALIASMIVFLFEGDFSWETLVFDFTINPLLWFAVILLGIGVLINLIILPSAAYAYGNYRKAIRISMMPIFVDVLLILLALGIHGNMDEIIAKHEAREATRVTQETRHRLIQAFSRDIWGKAGEDVTAEEFASIKYIAIDYGNKGNTYVRYSMTDYKDCADDEEFESTIQVWQCKADEVLPVTADIAMLTGLTYVKFTWEDRVWKTILPKENQITRIEIEESPKVLLDVIDPERLEVLHVDYSDYEIPFEVLGQFSNLKELKYCNSDYEGEVDLKSLTCIDTLERLYLDCGNRYENPDGSCSYGNLDCLREAHKLRSLYINNVTVKQIDFVAELKNLEELSVRYGEDGDISMLSALPKLKRLWLLDHVPVSASELEGLSMVEELRVTIESEESLEIIKELKMQLSALDLKILIPWIDYKRFDLSFFEEMKGLKELHLRLSSISVAEGVEKLLAMKNLKTLSLYGSWPDLCLALDRGRLTENIGVENLIISECRFLDRESGERMTEEFFAQFKGVKNLSLIDIYPGPESFAFLSGYEHLETIYLQHMFLSEEQWAELRQREDIEIIY